MLYVIFRFSAQTGTDSGDLSWRGTHKLVEITAESFETGWEEAQINGYTGFQHLLYPKNLLSLDIGLFFCQIFSI